MEANKFGLLFLVVFSILVFVVYRLLLSTMRKKIIKPIIACSLYWLFILITPCLLTIALASLGHYVYSNYPSIRVQSWDVALVFILSITMAFSYLLGLISAGIFTSRVLATRRKASS